MVRVDQDKWHICWPLPTVEEYWSFGLQLSWSSCCCSWGNIKPQDFLACSLEFTVPLCLPKVLHHFFMLIPNLAFVIADAAEAGNCMLGCYTVEKLLCKGPLKSEGRQWKFYMAVSGKELAWPCVHVKSTHVNKYVCCLYTGLLLELSMFKYFIDTSTFLLLFCKACHFVNFFFCFGKSCYFCEVG